GRAMDDIVPDAARVETRQHAYDREAPAILGSQQLRIDRKHTVGLVTDVPHTEEHRREGTQPDGDHHALEIDAVAHVGGGPGYAGRFVQKGVERLVQRVPLLVLAALFK